MKALKLMAMVALLAAGSISFEGCGEKTGVCTACCGPSGTTYCKDGWTKDECKEWSDQKVNGLAWTWHEDQTCAGRGTPATP
jgi:hypothetical protein